jgi:hypothetical protein
MVTIYGYCSQTSGDPWWEAGDVILNTEARLAWGQGGNRQSLICDLPFVTCLPATFVQVDARLRLGWNQLEGPDSVTATVGAGLCYNPRSTNEVPGLRSTQIVTKGALSAAGIEPGDRAYFHAPDLACSANVMVGGPTGGLANLKVRSLGLGNNINQIGSVLLGPIVCDVGCIVPVPFPMRTSDLIVDNPLTSGITLDCAVAIFYYPF